MNISIKGNPLFETQNVFEASRCFRVTGIEQVDVKTDVAARRLERLETDKTEHDDEARGQLERRSLGQVHSSEAVCRQMGCSHGTQLSQCPDWRHRLRPRQRRARRGGPPDRHRGVPAERERCSSP